MYGNLLGEKNRPLGPKEPRHRCEPLIILMEAITLEEEAAVVEFILSVAMRCNSKLLN
jgi:hypothetical protein